MRQDLLTMGLLKNYTRNTVLLWLCAIFFGCEAELIINGYDLNFNVAPCLTEGDQALECAQSVGDQIEESGPNSCLVISKRAASGPDGLIFESFALETDWSEGRLSPTGALTELSLIHI